MEEYDDQTCLDKVLGIFRAAFFTNSGKIFKMEGGKKEIDPKDFGRIPKEFQVKQVTKSFKGNFDNNVPAVNSRPRTERCSGSSV